AVAPAGCPARTPVVAPAGRPARGISCGRRSSGPTGGRGRGYGSSGTGRPRRWPRPRCPGGTVAGQTGDALALVREVLGEVGPTYRPFGDAELIGALVRGIGELEPGGPPFHWMETATPPGPGTAARCGWLDERGERAARALFGTYFPGSYAQPGRPGVRRWAGVHDESDPGRLLAVAADAWSGAGCGLLAGVVTHPRARGRGLGAAVSRFVVDDLVRRYGRAALLVDADNTPAIRAYERAGMRGRLFAAATAVPR
ncbi:GNAT family N-acetyltransferase, partial [Streptomyces carpinensis]